ncbi:hypothetical protein NTJ24_001929 [Yersinia ruckeri]|nr:hypothetical protein [Yersinia ruckeri]
MVPQASIRSTDNRVYSLTLLPDFVRKVFQPLSTVKSSLAGRGVYMPVTVKRGSEHECSAAHAAGVLRSPIQFFGSFAKFMSNYAATLIPNNVGRHALKYK